MQEGLQAADERSSERMKREQQQPSAEVLERIRQELRLNGFKPLIPTPEATPPSKSYPYPLNRIVHKMFLYGADDDGIDWS
jgi:hypothetical protein